MNKQTSKQTAQPIQTHLEEVEVEAVDDYRVAPTAMVDGQRGKLDACAQGLLHRHAEVHKLLKKLPEVEPAELIEASLGREGK